MKTTLLLALMVMLAFSLATAQTTKIVVGPLEGDDAGIINAVPNEAIVVDLWVRTASDVKIVGMHIPLSTKDDCIQPSSRVAGDIFFPIPLWDAKYFLPADPDPENEGYTNQSFLAVKDFIPGEDPDTLNAINTHGQWIRILSFPMTITSDYQNEPLDDALIMGSQQDNGHLVLVKFPTDEMDPSEYEVDLATLDVTLGVEDEIETPTSYALAQNYPNPFNASTTISYSLPQESNVTIDIYDIMGRKIQTLVSGHQPAGEHSVVWNANDVASGVYLYRINAGNYSETRRCNLIK